MGCAAEEASGAPLRELLVFNGKGRMDKAPGLAARAGGMEKAPGLGGAPEISAERGHPPQIRE